MPFEGKCLCFVTGASSGFGRSICRLLICENGLLSKAQVGSQIILMSRNIDQLKETRRLMKNISINTDYFSIQCESVDLSDANAVESKFSDLLKCLPNDFDHILFFNNAGSIADVSKPILDYQWSIDDYAKYFNLSIISSIFMINALLHKYSQRLSDVVIIQTSSLAAVQEMAYMPLYCAAKTSMDMFMKCVAKDQPNIKTLNYAPGPLDTPMGEDMKNKNFSDDTRQFFTHLYESGTIIKPEDSAGKLMGLLEKMEFESGAHIDYYDV